MIDFEHIFLSASGYDYFWQYGVLHRLTEEPGFDKVQNVYANSGGMAALSYVNARHFSIASLKEITEWWEEYGGKPRSMEWWVDNLVAHKDPSITKNLYPKNYFVGVSTVGGKFRWEKFCPQDASTYKYAVATAHIPGVTMALNIKQVLTSGIDGHWGFNPDVHLPPDRERTLVINALGKVPYNKSGKNHPHKISRTGLPSRIIGKISAKQHQKNFWKGFEAAEEWLANTQL